ncbi:hypothetical protein HMPREF1981_00005 [Bacteroides pyogenes F0041]|uniref:Uncharacterized protein n=1 Tax=Bacteroides pyogenes F0041 TaxID=1321819 RepID=U2CFM8_9BACE|nr:hypothetical protein HMPREF1981_00005 [Bacteroides pyogenes F0041]
MISPGFCFYTDNGEREREREREKASQTIVPLYSPAKKRDSDQNEKHAWSTLSDTVL